MKSVFLLCLLVLLMSACADTNFAESYTENTPEEEARIKLEEKDYDGAITAYEALIAENPTEYKYYPLLATAYAANAGVKIIDMVQAQIDSGGSGGAGIFDTMGTFVPDDPTDAQMTSLNTAIDWLESMPTDHRSDAGLYEYSAEASLSLTLYLAASSSMLLKRYQPPEVTNAEGEEEPAEFTREDLEEMSDEEVDALLDNLDTIAAQDSSTEANQAVEAQVEATLESIEAQEGATQKEKLINYLASTEEE